MASSLKVRGENVRLVRHGEASLALQFEYTNVSPDKISAADLGLIWGHSAVATVFDMPRGTGYRPQEVNQPLAWGPFPGPGFARVGPGVFIDIPPGGSATVTIMFPAPHAEATSMMLVMAGFLPVEVPVRPQGSPALRDDPVLRVPSSPNGEEVGPVVCTTTSKPSAVAESTRTRLPGDVLFAFGSAELSAAGITAIEQLATEVTAPTGVITIAGHTDGIGDEPANQQLSEWRAAAVRDRLAAKLSSGYTFHLAGFGETAPVAPNMRPDGSDDPDGRAQNRRVEVTVETTPGAQPGPTPAPLIVNSNLSASGIVATAMPVKKMSGTVLAQVQLRNGGSASAKIAYFNDLTSSSRPLHDAELRLSDGSGALHRPCEFWNAAAPNIAPTDVVVGTDFETELQPGATITMWTVFAAPPAEGRSVEVRIGGITDAVAATVSP